MRHIYLYRFSILLILALIGAGSAVSQTQGGVDVLLANARSLEARGRIDLAAQNWRKVLLSDPNQAEALAGLARSAKENDQPKEEASWLDRLRKVNPRDPEIEAVEKLRVFTPAERNRLDEAGRYAMQHQPDQAMTIYHQVLGDQLPPLGKWAEPYYETEAASNGGREKAISQLRQMCAQHPRQEAYRLWLSSLLTYDPKTRMEGFHLLESIDDPAFTEQARAPWRQALLWEKDNPEALSAMDAYLQRWPDADLQPIATALRSKQQQQIAATDNVQGFQALRGQHLEEAAARFTEVLGRTPNDVNAIVGLGYVRLGEKRFNDALGLFDHARTLAPQRQDARDGYENATFGLAMQHGATSLHANQAGTAVQAYQQALTLRPSDTGALLGLANALMQKKSYAEAGARFQQILNTAPNNADALAGLGFVRLNQGRFDDATKLFAEARRAGPARSDIAQGYRNAQFWGVMNQAAAALSQNRFRDAIAAYRQAIQQNPEDADAQHGLANAYVRAGDFAAAAQSYQQLTAAHPDDAANWLGLIRAEVGENTPQAAIATYRNIPPALRVQMEDQSGFLAEMALVDYRANQAMAGDQTLLRAMQLASTSDSDEALSLRLQIAGALIDQGKTGKAIDIYNQATKLHPDNPNGWEGLVGAYTRDGDFSQAVTAVRSMPQQSWQVAVKDTGFLDSVALLYSTEGRCAEAQYVLQRAIQLDRTAGRQAPEGTQLQLAYVLAREQYYTQAQDLYFDIVAKDTNSVDAWRGYLVVLHQRGADRTVAAEISRIPSAVRSQIETDPSFLILEASAYSSAGQNQNALTLLLQARSRYAAQHTLPPVPLDIQTAWTMLTVSPEDPGLGDLLLHAKARSGLTSQQRAAIEQLWSIWSVRRADRAFAARPQAAFSILKDAGREYPADRNIHAALASLYLKQHDTEKALDVFRTWGMARAQAGDYRMAAGTALSAHKNGLADGYLHQGLERFPQDPELMHMTARQDIARGDYDQGENELQSALLALREQDTSVVPQTRAVALPSVRESADDAAALHDHSGQGPGSFPSSATCRSEPAGGGDAAQGHIRPVNLTVLVSGGQARYALIGDGQQSPVQPQAQPPSVPAQAQPPSVPAQAQPQKVQEEQQMEDESEVVGNRNTPLLTVGGVGSGRLGDAGIDRLIVSDSLMGGAYTASNRLRFGLDAHGVYAYSGTPDGSSNEMFGTLPAHATFAAQSQTGYAGIAQLSTATFGMAAGTSPLGFPVHNVIGGIRYRPFNEWFTILGVRDSVKDSLLSYAGAVDPGTGMRWGGVVGNTVTVKYDSAPVTGDAYRRIGEYASGSYSLLQGLNVPDNWSVSGNAGFYWQVVQGLTVGVNANAEHYQKDLNFYSFGQGGYFSPQKYYLASAPIAWYSRHPRFEYQVKFSGGVQYLSQAASPFYPVLPGSASVTQGTYASSNSTVPNYSADIRLGYRVAPQVYFDTYATASNAQNYYQQSVGFNLRFMLDPIPTRTDLRVNSIPDWTGKQPFAVQ